MRHRTQYNFPDGHLWGLRQDSQWGLVATGAVPARIRFNPEHEGSLQDAPNRIAPARGGRRQGRSGGKHPDKQGRLPLSMTPERAFESRSAAAALRGDLIVLGMKAVLG